MGNPTVGFDDGFVGGSGDGFDPKGFDDKISGFDDAINTSEVEDFLGITPKAPLKHEDRQQLIKDGNDLIQKDLEDRKKSREYDRQQTTKDRPQVETKISMSFVDWSGFPGGAIHAAISSGSERKQSTTSRRASLTNAGAKDDDQRRAVLLKSKRRSSVGATTSSPEEEPQGSPRKEEPKFKNRRSSLRGGGITQPPAEKQDPQPPRRLSRRHSLDQGGSHHSAERRAKRRPTENKEGTDPPAERRGSAKGNRTESRGSGRPRRIQSVGRVRRPVQAAASSTTLEVNRIAPQRTTSGIRRPDRKTEQDPAAKVSLEQKNKGMIQKAPSIRSMQW